MGEFRSDWWAGGEDRAAAVESNYGFPTFPARPRECIRNAFVKEEFNCPPAAAIGRSEFEQGRERGAVVRRGSQRNPGGIPAAVKWFGCEFFVSFMKITSYLGKECLESCVVTRRFPPYHIPSGIYHRQPHYR